MSEYIYDTAKVETQPEQGFTGEEIVRCRDCEYYEAVPEDSGDWCDYWTDRIYADVRGSGFCKWGTRREK